MGDLGDLRVLAAWARGRGAAVVGISPLCDQLPVTPRQASPYSPSSRRWLDPNLIAPDLVDHAEGDTSVAELAAAGRRLNDEELVDRDRVWALKVRALRRLCAVARPDLDELVDRHGDALVGHAHASASAARHGRGWQSVAGAVPDLADAEARAELTFWAWLQDVAAVQLEGAAAEVGLLGDLPVGVDPGGADAWVEREGFALGWTIGAPPDEFNAAGQDWGLTPFDPAALVADGHRGLRDVLRANLGRFAGLRIDHVMGLFRLWWVPEGGGPTDGHYVGYDADAALRVVVEEANRAGAFLVGEDLGTVEPGVRERLARHRIAGMSVAWFDDRPPTEWPGANLGMLTTHDLPTVVGALRHHPELAARIRRFAEVDDSADEASVLVAAHERLAGGASGLVIATMEDLVGTPHQVNVAGTVQPSNWSRPLPVRIEDLDDTPLVGRVIDALSHR